MVAAPPSESELGAAQILCWRCKKPGPLAFFCPCCEAVQPLPATSNYSTLLGFAGRPAIDETELQKRYYELSRRLHPDRFQTSTREEQRASLQATALLNSAFKTLKDVESRGRWWLENTGESLGRNNNQVPAELAARVFEIQEKIADLADSSGTRCDELRGDLRRTQTDLANRVNEEEATVDGILRDWPRDHDAGDARAELKRVLSKLSYLRTLARDVRGAIED